MKSIKKISIVVCIWLLTSTVTVFAAQLMLPFEGGSTWTCNQENNDTPTHTGNLLYAWDFNMGINDLGEPVLAPADGEVVYARNSNTAWGKVVIIDYGDDTWGKLAHLEDINVSENQNVIQGQQIGTCGGTGGWSPHIHYQTQSTGDINGSSIPSTFLDAEEADGIPKLNGYYTSLNTYNPYNNFKVGKFAYDWEIEPWGTSFGSYFAPYSRPFAITYHHEGGLNSLGHPADEVHLLTALEIPGYNASLNTDACYIQNIQNTSGGEPWLTLVLNPYVWNIRMNYLGVVYPIQGQIRDYWRLYYSEYGPPVNNEYTEIVNGKLYVVQWFEKSDNDFLKITYDTTDGSFNDPETASIAYGDHLNQSVWDNLGCPNGDCGVGGGVDPIPSDDYTINRSTTCKDIQPSDPWNPISETTLFYNDDSYVCSWIHLDNIYKSLNINWKWYNPNNILVSESSYTTDDPASYGYDYWDWYKSWSSLNIINANSYGQWHVDIYIDGQKVKTNYFTLTIDLSAPTELTAETISESQINLSWNSVSNATGYKIYRDNALITTLTNTTYSDTVLSDNTQYCYKVKAYYGNMNSDYSDQICATTQTAEIPFPIADFTANPTSGDAPLYVVFTDTSTGEGIYQYNWIFDDGHTCSTQNATHTFQNAGTYNVRHQVTNARGSNTRIRQINVYVPDNCPDDPNKTEPGICGCNVPDVDTDGDGIADCGDLDDDDDGMLDSWEEQYGFNGSYRILP
ncbi:peptidoglycan DD-metalloendopeptidase family protein, partial [Candidatus Parcubacteria bacterium]|nr:peptidoglycan DD-metalloendopeptidase family protein [Candidatus Parcubacteria bacterium]